MRALSAIAVGMLLSGCAPVGQQAPELKLLAPVALNAAQTDAVEAGVRHGLKDPASAQFRNMRAGQNGESVTVCGEVNARNSFGGFAGFSPFIGMLSKHKDTGKPAFIVISMESTGNGPIITRKLCSEHGLA